MIEELGWCKKAGYCCRKAFYLHRKIKTTEPCHLGAFIQGESADWTYENIGRSAMCWPYALHMSQRLKARSGFEIDTSWHLQD